MFLYGTQGGEHVSEDVYHNKLWLENDTLYFTIRKSPKKLLRS